MPNLPSRLRDAVSGRDLDHRSARVPARLVRATRDAVQHEQAQSLVDEARAHRVGRVAATGLRVVEELSAQETLALQRTPVGDRRYQAIVDAAAMGIAHLVAETARD